MTAPLTYASVCSGIGTDHVAWAPLGWRAAFFAELAGFPSAVLEHRFAGVPNLGDFTRIGADDVEPVELLVGGTPCQSFSVAGKRGGLDDPRGNLALEFLALARRLRPRWLVWENVGGVFSNWSGGPDDRDIPPGAEWSGPEANDFATFLAAAGECGYYGAYRVLDAQYVRVDGYPGAVPQRRRRVFFVGYLGDWRGPAAVLLEPEGLRRDPPPRRAPAQDVAGTLVASSARRGGTPPADSAAGGLVAAPLCASNPYGDQDARESHLVAHTLRGEGFDASEDGTGRGTPMIPIAFHARQDPDCGEVTHPLDTDGCSIGVAYQCHGGNVGNVGEMGTLRTGNGHLTGGVPFVSDGWAVRRLTPRECERLQGLPDDHTRIPWRGKPAEACPDGPRYAAIGNGFPANSLRWIGRRIEMFEQVVGRP